MSLRSSLLICIIFLAMISCKPENESSAIATARTEIINTEKAFAEMAKSDGLKAAFLAFAADSAVLNRGKKIIKGKQAIAEYYENQTLRNVQLEWQPDFVEVSVSGDLGYTYGPYQFKATDEAGNVIEDTGIFHTVWRKQEDGNWRYVWD